MRLASTIALVLLLAIGQSPARAQDGSPAAPATDTAADDPAARQSPWGRSNIDLDHDDRLYATSSASGSVAVVDPSNDRLLGTIPLGRSLVSNRSRSQDAIRSARRLAYSPDGRTLAVVSGGARAVSFVDTGTNQIVHVASYDAAPEGASYSPDGREVWIPIKSGRYLSILDGRSFSEISRIRTASDPGMTIFSNDGRRAFVCSRSGLEIVDVRKRKVVASVPYAATACSSIAASPDGRQIWVTSEEAATAISAKPPFHVVKAVPTGHGTQALNFVSSDAGQFAYVTVGGRQSAVKVIDTQSFETVATIPLKVTPSGIWPSGDGSRIYVGSSSDDAVVVIDAANMRVTETLEVGSRTDAVAFVPYAGRRSRRAGPAPLPSPVLEPEASAR